MKKILFLAGAALCLLIPGCGKEKKTPPASVTFSGPPGMQASCGGRQFDKLDFKMTPGSRIFKFTAPGYSPEWRKIVVAPQDRKLEIKVEMTRWQSAALIATTAAGMDKGLPVSVKCDGISVGATPCLVTGIAQGEHQVLCSCAGYAESSITWSQDSPRPKPRFQCNLVSVIGKLIVASEPQGAAISIKGRKSGTAPCSFDLEAGKYEIIAQAENYTPARQWVEVRRGAESTVQIKLQPRPAELKINSDPAGAVITVDGEKRGTTPCRIENLEPRNYKIVWRKTGYDPVEKIVEVLAGSSEEISPALQPSSGSVRLTIRPAGVNVNIDGRPVGRTESDPRRKGETKPITVGNLAPGKHICTLSHPRANPPQKNVTFVIEKGKLSEIPPIDLWIANCILEYSDNEPQRGALLYEKEDSLMFSPSPGIIVEVKRSMLKKITMIDVDEK